MTEKVLAVVDLVFAEEERPHALRVLRDDIVGPPRLNERIQLAALQLSDGDLNRLDRIIADACQDFRRVIFDAQAEERNCDADRNSWRRLTLRRRMESEAKRTR